MRSTRTARVSEVVDAVGRALLLQVTFVLVSVPLVTVLPAALALQRRLDALAAGEGGGVRAMVVESGQAGRRCWPLAVLAPVLAAGLVQAFWFWLRWPSPVRQVATGLLAMVAGLSLCLWVGLLAAARVRLPTSSRGLLRDAWGEVLRQPLRVLWAVVLVITWLVLGASLPALLLVGCGLGPALAVRLAVRPPPHRPLRETAPGPGQATRS